MAILITGGAGYIGSHVAHCALDRGEQVVILDNLTTGIRTLPPQAATFVEGDAGDTSLVVRLAAEHDVDAVLHFAGSTVVPESVECPLKYYGNNTVVSRNLIAATVQAGVRNMIFSSTAAVYGDSSSGMVTERSPVNPKSPYGRSKLMVEWILQDTSRAHDLRYVALRYFNVAGADPQMRTGQSTPLATHLIKRACQVALGKAPCLEIFGTDYETPDGTGIRDFIHVTDLALAHLLTLDYLREGRGSAVINCGYGHGASVRQVIRAVERAAGVTLPVRESPRRAGDIPSLAADPALLKETFGWNPTYDDLDLIVASALAWERRISGTL